MQNISVTAIKDTNIKTAQELQEDYKSAVKCCTDASRYLLGGPFHIGISMQTYIVSNRGLMSDELERIRKEIAMA
jgi:hypothetical protein